MALNAWHEEIVQSFVRDRRLLSLDKNKRVKRADRKKIIIKKLSNIIHLMLVDFISDIQSVYNHDQILINIFI